MSEQTLEEAIEDLVEYVQGDSVNADRLQKYEHAVFEAAMHEHCPLYFAYVNLRLEDEDE